MPKTGTVNQTSWICSNGDTLGTDGFVDLPPRDRPYGAGSVVALHRW